MMKNQIIENDKTIMKETEDTSKWNDNQSIQAKKC